MAEIRGRCVRCGYFTAPGCRVCSGCERDDMRDEAIVAAARERLASRPATRPWIGDPDWLEKWAAEWRIPYRPHTH